MIRALTDPRHDHDHDVTDVMTVFMTAADLRWSEEVHLVLGEFHQIKDQGEIYLAIIYLLNRSNRESYTMIMAR